MSANEELRMMSANEEPQRFMHVEHNGKTFIVCSTKCQLGDAAPEYHFPTMSQILIFISKHGESKL